MKLIIQQLRKDNMGTNLLMKLLLLVMFLSTGIFALAQSNYCYNQVGKNIDFPMKRADSLYLDYDKIDSSGYITIVNPTKDTLYLVATLPKSCNLLNISMKWIKRIRLIISHLFP